MQKLIYTVGDKNVAGIITSIESALNIKLENSNSNLRNSGFVSTSIEGGIKKIEVCLFEGFDLDSYPKSMSYNGNISNANDVCTKIVQQAS
jgi:hypothetical protein